MKLKTCTLAVSSLLLATGIYAQDDVQQQTPGEQIRSGIERILTPDESAAGASRMSAEQAMADWKQKPKETAQKLIAKYGQPDEVTSRRLVWHNNGQWKRTEIMNDDVQHDFPVPHTDFLKQTIDFRVPSDKFDELAMFDGSITAERTRGELSNRCDKEENNILGLNVAQDIIKGTRSVEEAREFLSETMMTAMQGENPPNMQKLQFSVAKAGTADPDQPGLNEAAGAEQKTNKEE